MKRKVRIKKIRSIRKTRRRKKVNQKKKIQMMICKIHIEDNLQDLIQKLKIKIIGVEVKVKNLKPLIQMSLIILMILAKNLNPLQNQSLNLHLNLKVHLVVNQRKVAPQILTKRRRKKKIKNRKNQNLKTEMI